MNNDALNADLDALRAELTLRLGKADIALDDAAWAGLLRHLALVREWNPFVSLVSIPDLNRLEHNHMADSLSLAPWIQAHGASGVWLDIGSGGGFPAIPIKLVLPQVSLVLVERSGKKVGFLRKVVGALDLDGVQIRQGEFPQAVSDVRPGVITARAVERPSALVPLILDAMPQESAFLCQTGPEVTVPAATFHVEPIEDAWTASGLRRGTLHVVRRP